MISRLRRRVRSLGVSILERTGHLDQALEVRQRLTRQAAAVQQRVAQRKLDTTMSEVPSGQTDAVGALVGPPGSRRGVIGRVRDEHRVVDAMRSNRDLAITALTAAKISYQQLPVDTPNRYRIGVPESARSAFLDALTGLDATVYVFLDASTISPSKRVARIDAEHVRQIERRSREANVVRVFEYLVIEDGRDEFGELHGCEIEFWDDQLKSGPLLSARWNEFATSLTRAEFGRVTPESLITAPAFPIDLVYTWVDGDDPAWQERRAAVSGTDTQPKLHAEAASDARFASRNELLYSLRSVERYADFVRHIYIVTDRQVPEWLDTDAPGITVVDHSEIFPEGDALPTFNSHAIESRLHHIPGLSERYLYLNDDFLFGRRVLPDRFFLSNGLAKHFLSRSLIPLGPPTLEHKPVDAAAMTGRGLIEEVFRVTPTRKFKHAPYPQLRSVNLEIESLFPDEMERTMRSRFRHPTDIAVASSLHHHVAYMTGKSVPDSITSRYVDLGQSNLEARLDRLLIARDFDTLCLNDSDLDGTDDGRKSALVAEFLDAYLPVKSRFEK